MPDCAQESAAYAAGFGCIAGVDEVGRGPIAGPVTAAAVVLDLARVPDGLDDSKRLSAARRIELAARLRDCAQVSISHASVAEIAELNILRASHLAMRRAVAGLVIAPDLVLVDGHLVPAGLSCEARTFVKGDARVQSIAAASIVAKVARDALMVDLAQQHPGYGWERNAGYPTKTHLEALLNLGPTPWHRCNFAPVHKILYQYQSSSL